MPRRKIMKVAALNIKTHPHSSEGYIRLFKDSYEIRAAGKIKGFDWGIIGSLHEDKGFRDTPIIRGMIYRYLNIDPTAPWLDFSSLTPIEEANLKSKPIIPGHLKPNLKRISYIFYPTEHRFFFDCKSISPGGMMVLMDELFKNDTLLQKYGVVDVSIESTREAIQKILAIPHLTKLYIDFSRPNDDDLGSIEERIFERIDKQKIRRIEQTATSMGKDGIFPDDETKAFMNMARSNGVVCAKGHDETQKIEISTIDHPYIETKPYDPHFKSDFQVLLETSDEMLHQIKKR